MLRANTIYQKIENNGGKKIQFIYSLFTEFYNIYLERFQ